MNGRVDASVINVRGRSTSRRVYRLVVFGVLLVGAFSLLASVVTGIMSKDRVPVREQAVPVVVDSVTVRDLPIWRSAIGAVQSLKSVNVKVRVDGQLTSVAFTEGQDVRAGDLLAEIDSRPYKAQLKQAQANRLKDLAQLGSTHVDLDRASKLADIGAGPTQTVDTLRAQVASLEATIEADQAAIDTAQLNLSFTRITAPFDGRTGQRLMDPGSIVHVSDGSGLVSVTQILPIAVTFSLPQDDLGEILQGQSAAPLIVAVESRDGSRHLADGKLVFIDNQIQTGSGQILLKAEFPNANHALWPGQFVSARLLLRTDRNVMVVPSRAIQHSQKGSFVYTVSAQGKAEMQPVKTGADVDGFTALLSGTSPGDKIVVDGQSRLSPGSQVEEKGASGAAS